MMHLITVFSLFILVFGKPLTEQTPDILVLRDQTYYLKSFPLDDLKLWNTSQLNDSIELNSGCWRGYQATWVVRNDSLFLTGMTDCYKKYQIDLESYFAERKPKVEVQENELFAYWYDAKLIQYQHPFLNEEESAKYLYSIDWRELKKNERVVLTFKNGIINSKKTD